MGDYGLRVGTPELASVGAITFSPDGMLFIADSLGARVVAVDVGDDEEAVGTEPFEVDDLIGQISSYLGCDREDVVLRDLEVHPRSHNVYLSVSKGKGRDGTPLILKLASADGTPSIVELVDVPFSEAPITNAPGEDQEMRGAKMRASTVTDMAYADGTLLVAGMSNEEFSSNLRRIPFPFTDDTASNSLEIFHVSHGGYETAAPIRTFVPYRDDQSIIASYTCTPLVKFSLADLTDGTQAKGHTVAELGAGNQPIDMVSFERDGAEFLLVSNSRHPLMRIAADDIDRQEPLHEPRTPTGTPFEALPQPGVTKLANLNGAYVLALQTDGNGVAHLRSLATAAL